MKITYKLAEIDQLHYYYYEWIDYLGAIIQPNLLIDNYEFIEDSLKDKFLSIGWDQKNDIGLIWIPPFVLGSILKGGIDSYLKKYPNKVNCGDINSIVWTKGMFIFHVKNIEDGTSILLAPLELEIPNYGL